MKGRFFRILSVFLLFALLSSPVLSQQQTGSIRGVITDPDGMPLPGVNVTVTSVAIMGPQSYVSSEVGAFRFPALPPGTYKLTAEVAGFKTFVRENIVVRVGMNIVIDFGMEVAAVEEEITITAASPVVDVQSTKIAVIMDNELLKNLPLARDLYDIMTAAPGAVSEGQSYRRTYSIHGATVRGNTTAFDGVNMNDPVVMYTLTNINFDVMDEVESITAGHPASVGYTDGAYVNIVTKSGGNKFTGGATVYFTNQSLAQHLWTDEQVQALEVAKPEVAKTWFDGSVTLGGPIAMDKLWFFGNARMIKQELKTNFIGPWTDILGYTHNPYDWTHDEKMGFIKLTGQLGSKVKLMGMFNIVDIYRPMYEQPGSRQPFISTRIWDHERGYTGNAVLNYILDQNTFLDFRFGYVHRWFPLPMQDEAQSLPWVSDYGDLYGGLTTARFNETYLRKRMQFGAYFTRFQDDFLGGSHEFKGGVEYESNYGDWDWYRQDNMLWYMDSRYPPNNYYYRTYGLLYFYICGPDSGSTHIKDKGARIGAYIQDSATFADRLTVNVGIRFDRSWGWKPAVDKAQAGNPLSVYIGEEIIKPYVADRYPENFPDGINPWAANTSPEWNNIIQWNEWSPRLGLTYDLFGDGRTALKASFNRYTEYLMLQYFSTLHPFYPRSFGVYWYDDNGNATPDIEGDRYVPLPSDFRGMDPEFAKQRLDPNTKSPISDEFTAGIWHELFQNFSIGLNFIYKEKKNILEDALYAPDTDEYWYHPDQAAAKNYWIPFTTTIPGTDDYPDRDVTFYVRRNSAPEYFYRLTNVSELKRKYYAGELIFNKRMSDGWQLGGSIVISKAEGNIGGWYGESWGWSGGGDNPNAFVNAYGRINTDRPLQIKLYGTVQLPYRIFLSGFYQYQSGSPWTRYVSIRPPSSWSTANDAYRTFYGVNLETEGSRRNRAWNQLDIRLEKEFALGSFGRLGAYIDVTNLLGYSGVGVGLDDVYRWEPVAEGVNQDGTKTLESGYKVIDSVSGLREVKLSLRFSF